MNKPRPVPGWCPFYDQSSDKCYLAETTPSSGTREQKCKLERNCHTCGNYEAWKKGTNYKSK